MDNQMKLKLMMINWRNEKKILNRYCIKDDQDCACCETRIKTYFGSHSTFKGCMIATNVPHKWYCGIIIFCQECSQHKSQTELETFTVWLTSLWAVIQKTKQTFSNDAFIAKLIFILVWDWKCRYWGIWLTPFPCCFLQINQSINHDDLFQAMPASDEGAILLHLQPLRLWIQDPFQEGLDDENPPPQWEDPQPSTILRWNQPTPLWSIRHQPPRTTRSPHQAPHPLKATRT